MQGAVTVAVAVTVVVVGTVVVVVTVTVVAGPEGLVLVVGYRSGVHQYMVE